MANDKTQRRRRQRQQQRQRQEQQQQHDSSLGALVSLLTAKGQFTPAPPPPPPDLFSALITYLDTLPSPPLPDAGSFPRGRRPEVPVLSQAEEEARDRIWEFVGTVAGIVEGDEEMEGEGETDEDESDEDESDEDEDEDDEDEDDEDEDEEMEEEEDDDDDDDDDKKEMEKEMDPPRHFGAFYGD
ncbi:hypothetical protein EG327_007498 [Venturia inaequalis]|uniref:Uncharacterized protein n=1 Tax=Venturia inaequalis TaxID=5025 RepID=A0A8H3VRT3_VENIN|nr:hypothetical protein EG327_007498 [Venturia inaequalis]